MKNKFLLNFKFLHEVTEVKFLRHLQFKLQNLNPFFTEDEKLFIIYLI